MKSRSRVRRALVLLLLGTTACATAPGEPRAPADATASVGPGPAPVERPVEPPGARLEPPGARLEPPGVRLPPPPPDAAGTRRELDRILEIQAAASADRLARARADAELSLFRLLPDEADDADDDADVWRPPSLVALSDRVAERVLRELEPIKTHYARPRPYAVDPAIHSCIPPLESFSYPSGHAAFAFAGARILSELAPERASQIWARAREFAWSRVVCGVHFPSDVAAGEALGEEIALALLASPSFLRGLDAPRRDLRAGLGLAPERAPSDRSSGLRPGRSAVALRSQPSLRGSPERDSLRSQRPAA